MKRLRPFQDPTHFPTEPGQPEIPDNRPRAFCPLCGKKLVLSTLFPNPGYRWPQHKDWRSGSYNKLCELAGKKVDQNG